MIFIKRRFKCFGCYFREPSEGTCATPGKHYLNFTQNEPLTLSLNDAFVLGFKILMKKFTCFNMNY